MQIGFIGLGKLGFPCAVALAMKGHRVFGYDTDRTLVEGYQRGEVTPFEPGLETQYASARERITFCPTVREAVAASDIIFVAVPTPHAPQHDGSFPYDGVPRDFDNTCIRESLAEIAEAIEEVRADGRFRTVLIISTVTPGTTVGELYPAMQARISVPIGEGWDLVYNPFFIAQSTVVKDFLNPEFVLLGHRHGWTPDCRGVRAARELYRSLHAKPQRPMTWTEAECVKLCYNTYLGLKVLFANAVMELCDRLPGTNCDVVNGTLKLATERLISPRYMDGGMADGGPCHGRDQMAMSYSARNAGMSFNIFDAINIGRDRQTGWLADKIIEHKGNRPVVLLGMAFKPGTNQTQGSPAMLLYNILKDRGVDAIQHDPVLRPDAGGALPDEPALYFVATRWEDYRNWSFKPGDVVLDPWRYLSTDQEGVRYVPIGVCPEPALEVTCPPSAPSAPAHPARAATHAS